VLEAVFTLHVWLVPEQVDLTDDYVVAALFGDPSWEQQLQRVQVDAPRNGIDLLT
jgi:hypothetical protein